MKIIHFHEIWVDPISLLLGIEVISGSLFDFISLILFSHNTGIDKYKTGNYMSPNEAGLWNTARFVSFGIRIHLLTKYRKRLELLLTKIALYW